MTTNVPTPRRPFTDPVSYYDASGNMTTFKPLGRPIIINKRGVPPPALCARIVLEADPTNLSMQVPVLRSRGELIVFERGVFGPVSGRAVTRPGAQACVFNWEQTDKDSFTAAMCGLASIVAKANAVKEAFVEVREGEFVVGSKLVEAAP